MHALMPFKQAIHVLKGGLIEQRKSLVSGGLCLCRVHYKLQSGAYGFTMLEDKEYIEKDKQHKAGDEAADDSSNSR